MPFNNATEPSQDDSSDKARQQRPKNLTDIKERFFLIDYARYSMETSLGVTAVLDVIEANEHSQADAPTLAVSGPTCEALQTLALLSARLLANYALQEVELMDARKHV
ncbi:hypothetical protein ACVBEF_17660 [Glaciimonas sp. GG7]